MSKVSVAMATYNAEGYLLEQLDSLRSQTRQPDEVIICDDHSSDATVSIIQNYLQEHTLPGWRLIENTENLGYVRNFRKAMAQTTADFVFLCDQDDVWAADKIRVMTQVLEENEHILALTCGYDLIDAEGKTIQTLGKRFYTPAPGAGKLSAVKSGRVLYWNMAQGCTGAYRRSLVDDYEKSQTNGRLAHDWALHLLAYERQGLYFWDQELVSYRIHGKNATGIRGGSRREILKKDVDALADALHLPLKGSSQKEIRRIMAFYQHRIAWLQSGSVVTWLRGWPGCLRLMSGRFCVQYCKDFLTVVAHNG